MLSGNRPEFLFDVFVSKAETYGRWGKYPDARKAYEEALKIAASPANSSAAYEGIGRYHYLLGEYQPAIENLTTSLDGPDVSMGTAVNSYVLLGESYSKLGDENNACDMYKKAFKLSSDANYGWGIDNSQPFISQNCQ